MILLVKQIRYDLLKCLVFCAKLSKSISGIFCESDTSYILVHLLSKPCIKHISISDNLVSIMKGIDHQIYMLIIVHEDMGWGEILNYFPKKEHRTVGRAIKRLVENNEIGYDKIRGKGKWKRYFVKEENTKNNLLFEAVNGNKKKWKYVRVPITQRKLSKGISESMQ